VIVWALLILFKGSSQKADTVKNCRKRERRMVRQIEIRVATAELRNKVLACLDGITSQGIARFVSQPLAVDMFIVIVHVYTYNVSAVLAELLSTGCGVRWGYVTVINLESSYPRLDCCSADCDPLSGKIVTADAPHCVHAPQQLANVSAPLHPVNGDAALQPVGVKPFPWKPHKRRGQTSRSKIDDFKRSKKSVDEIHNSVLESNDDFSVAFVILIFL
jgi:hypothetical protein